MARSINEYADMTVNESLDVAYELAGEPVQVSLNVIREIRQRKGAEKALSFAETVLKIRSKVKED